MTGCMLQLKTPLGAARDHKKYLWNKGGSGNFQAALIWDLTKSTALTCDSRLISWGQLISFLCKFSVAPTSSEVFNKPLQNISPLSKSRDGRKVQRLRLPSSSSNRQPSLISSLSSSYCVILSFSHSLFAFPLSSFSFLLLSYFSPSFSEHRHI